MGGQDTRVSLAARGGRCCATPAKANIQIGQNFITDFAQARGVSAIDVAVSLKYVLSQKFIPLISFLQILQKLEPFSLPASGNVYDSGQWWLHQAHPVPVTRLFA